MTKNKYKSLAILFLPILAVPLASKAIEFGLPYQSRATSDDATAMFYNPSGLAVQEGVEFMYMQGFQQEGDPNATSLYLKLPFLGFGFQRLHEEGYNLNRFTVPLGVPLLRAKPAAIFSGIAMDVWNATDPDEKAFVDWRLGAQARLFNFLALGFEASQLTTPQVWGVEYPPVLTAGGAISLLNRRIVLTADKSFVQDRGNPAPVFGLETEFLNGISLTGHINTDSDFGAGISIDLAHIGAKGYARSLSPASDGEDRKNTYIVGLRLSEDRYRSVIEPSGEFIKLTLDENIYSEAEFSPFEFLFGEEKLSLFAVTEGIKRAAQDKAITGILLYIKSHDLSIVELGELRSALARFKKESGKAVYIYLDDADNKNYYLASVGDKIFINPAGSVILSGLSASQTYFKGTLEWAGVSVQPVRAGKYKSAVEPFTRTLPSEESAEAINALLDDVNDSFIKAICEGRNIDEAKLKKLIDEETFFSPQDAREKGLIDEIAYFDEVEDKIEAQLKRNIFYVNDYFHRKYRYYRLQGKPVVAVVEIKGAIVDGRSGGSFIFGNAVGDEDIVEALDDIANDPRVAAIIIRVNSPGGSGLASDKILRKIIRTRKEKPVVVSMGSEAASGGYYVSAAAEHIYANPTTVTGSIGVFVLHFSAEELYSKLRLSHAKFKRGERADYDSSWRTLSDDEIQDIQRVVDAFYAQFISQVSSERNLPKERVAALAQGRVWSGKAAVENKLADKLGGFIDALDKARELAGLTEDEQLELEFYPKRGFKIGSVISGVQNLLDSGKESKFKLIFPDVEEIRKFDNKPLYLAPEKIEIR
ncbi:MAG: hypothetical protein Kow0090_11960 [Myxococcota bacterium]